MGSIRRTGRQQAAVVALVAAAGCATTMDQVPPDQPEAYRSGYAAGCDSGYVAAGHPYYRFSKDAAAYGADDLYRQGWDDGFAVCKGKYEAVRQSVR